MVHFLHRTVSFSQIKDMIRAVRTISFAGSSGDEIKPLQFGPKERIKKDVQATGILDGHQKPKGREMKPVLKT